MITVILVDRNGVIHDVFVADHLSKLEIEEIEQGARSALLSAIVRSATLVECAQDVLVDIVAINEATTAEVVHVECGPCESVRGEHVGRERSTPPVSGFMPQVDPSVDFFDLDWDEFEKDHG